MFVVLLKPSLSKSKIMRRLLQKGANPHERGFEKIAFKVNIMFSTIKSFLNVMYYTSNERSMCYLFCYVLFLNFGLHL